MDTQDHTIYCVWIHFIPTSLHTRREEKHLIKAGIKSRSCCFTSNLSNHLTMAPRAIVGRITKVHLLQSATLEMSSSVTVNTTDGLNRRLNILDAWMPKGDLKATRIDFQAKTFFSMEDEFFSDQKSFKFFGGRRIFHSSSTTFPSMVLSISGSHSIFVLKPQMWCGEARFSLSLLIRLRLIEGLLLPHN